ncbi:MAG: 30S ribosomal protein S8 [Candidatus Pacebacteria bacterium]|jgi:small subunit ribosomal protein S8|nr:30S ribosomal protein S8 [Parcubacteria group bacterium]MDP6249413.1 30S ribosomal protein S8 [Candidatus Paceibacterota bacterium]MDP7159605.1 30S ribosomal protein S8 [Candidatus Paceibacterota bacterium]MDP7466213.1 30S ribosomal protein S8 [Candidatus Paceibacterota bacterium]HJO89828.1 30S ribosomal protein S8 [Candidatus Paceibacterota bacterium]|tara:strand:+ start:1949 stop:2341 length:393 start_codon:yes stop_codon:yes gene_type:complete
MVSDSIGDLIIQLKNAGNAGKTVISVPYSEFKFQVAEKLKEKGYTKSVSRRGKKIKKYLDIELEYKGKSPRINGVTRISKPGRRIYKKTSEIFPVKYGKGAIILSTPDGILTGEEARKKKMGGEALFKIW